MNREELPKDMAYCCRNKLGACYNCFYQEIWYLKYIIYFFTVGPKNCSKTCIYYKKISKSQKKHVLPL